MTPFDVLDTGFASRAERAADAVRGRLGDGFAAALYLGSGLGPVMDELGGGDSVAYSDIPGFPRSTVEGHAGRLAAAEVAGARLLVMQGRFHRYEGYAPADLALPPAVFRALGARVLILTNAAGGLNPRFEVGDLMGLTGQISFMGAYGATPAAAMGRERPGSAPWYDSELLDHAERAALEAGVRFRRGVLLVGSGPSYETASEVGLQRLAGGDAVTMSTVPEAEAAHHAGFRILGISTITNRHVPWAEIPTTHDEVVQVTRRASRDLARILSSLANSGVLGRTTT
jgi:purine-nucleoside phosphorylase